MRMIIATGFVLMLGALGACADTDSTTPEEACLFFFDVFGEGIQDSREAFARHRVTREIDFGDPASETFGIPRYLSIFWPSGIAETGPVRQGRGFSHEDNIAFSLECIVDVVDQRVLRIDVGWGDRLGETLPIGPTPADGSPRERETVSARPYTVNVAATIMRGLY